MDFSDFFSDRARAIDTSGIRRIFHLGAHMKDPINLSIGQPDFPVPDAIKRAAIEAIENDRNGYTLTQGIDALQALKEEMGIIKKEVIDLAPEKEVIEIEIENNDLSDSI